MRAIEYSEFGGPEVLRLVEVDRPEPGPGQVVVVIRAAGVNPYDLKQRAGTYGGDLPVRPGVDIAGLVDAAGPDAPFAVGDAVFGKVPRGGYAGFAVAGRQLALIPPTLDAVHAAALPTPGEAALRGLNVLSVGPGETLVITGAAGSVGVLAVQIAVARGVRVIGAVRTGDEEDLISSLGATAVRTDDESYPDRVRDLAGGRADAALDAAGAGLLPVLVGLTGGPERVVTLADPAATEHGVHFSGAGDPTVPDPMAELADLAVREGFHQPPVTPYPLTEAARAHADVEARRVTKAVLIP